MKRPQTVTLTEARRRFGHLLARAARGETVVITRRGVPYAVLLSAERYQLLTNPTRKLAIYAQAPVSSAQGLPNDRTSQ